MKPPFDIAGRSRHAGLGVPEARARSGRVSCSRASRAASVSRAIRSSASATRSSSARLQRPARRRRGGFRRPPTGAELARRSSRRAHAAPRPTRMPGVPLAGGLVGDAGYRRRALLRAAAHPPAQRSRLPVAALCGARLPARLRSPDARHRAAARRARGRAREAAPRSQPRAAWRPAGAAAQRRTRPARLGLERDGLPRRVRRAQEHIAAGDVYQLVLSVRFDGPACSSTRSRSIARCA